MMVKNQGKRTIDSQDIEFELGSSSSNETVYDIDLNKNFQHQSRADGYEEMSDEMIVLKEASPFRLINSQSGARINSAVHQVSHNDL